MPTILLIRHGQASHGAADYDKLSATGEDQARLVARELRRRQITIDTIVSGSLARQRGTAAPTVAQFDRPLMLDPRFNEYDADDVLRAHSDTTARANHVPGAPALSSVEFQRVMEKAQAQWIAAGDDSTADETWPAFQRRTIDALTELAAGLPSGATALAFTSAGVIATLACEILGLPATAKLSLNRVSVNASTTKIASGRSGLSLVSFNEHAYLEGAEPSMVTLR